MEPSIEYTSVQSLLVHGPEALHSDFSSKVKRVIGKTLPQMEVRFKNLTLSTEVSVPSGDAKYELPTITNELKGGARNTTKATKYILKHVSGVFQPGTMTLVLGQPGSGKSSLLKMLSGRFPLTKTIQLDGEVIYNDHDRLELTKQLTQLVTYVTQRDNHLPTLSVQETLKFAYDCCGGELYDEKYFTKGSFEEVDAALESFRALKEHHVDLMVQQLGLENCQGTLVGDTTTRGVSGGERKRVAMGEMGFGNHVVHLMDEVSTGLDSAATLTSSRRNAVLPETSAGPSLSHSCNRLLKSSRSSTTSSCSAKVKSCITAPAIKLWHISSP